MEQQSLADRVAAFGEGVAAEGGEWGDATSRKVHALLEKRLPSILEGIYDEVVAKPSKIPRSVHRAVREAKSAISNIGSAEEFGE